MPLVVRLLGAPELWLDGEAVRFDTRKALALVAYLAVTGRKHTREELAALLWPESDATRARSALRRTLSTASSVGPALLVDRSGAALDPAAVDCDVTGFLAASEAGFPAARHAVAAYRADFLEGFSLRDSPEFDEWSASVRDRLRRELDRLLERLVDDHVERAELPEALELARRRVDLDPLNESAHQSAMRLYDWNGQRSEALKQYRRCVRVLDRELGVAPLPETTTVYEAVSRRRLPAPALAAPSARREAPEPKLATAGVPADRPSEPVFVGRVAELAVLRRAWETARSQGSACALVGEVGSGKTALLAAFAASLRPGAHVLEIRGHEGEQDLPYRAAADLVRAVDQVDPGALGRLATRDQAAVAWLVPSLAAVRPSEPADGLAPSDRGRVFDAVRSAVLEAVPGEGRVLVVEDAHWLDPESADLVAYLVRRPAAALMVVTSWRGTASPVPVAAALGEALAVGRGSIVRLGGLDPEDIGALLTAYGRPAGPEEVSSTSARTGGLPLLVVEQARSDGREGADGTGGSEWAGLDSLVLARIDAAPETTRQVLGVVALLAAPTDPDLLRMVSGRTDQEVVAALEDAVARGLLVELPGTAEYDVPHETLRRLATGLSSLARRRLLHGRAADALRMSSSSRSAQGAGWTGAVARHLELAGRTDEAAEWHVEAARQASAVFAHATAESHLASALALGHDAMVCHVGLGEARVRLGRYDEAMASYEQAAAAASGLRLADVEHRIADVRLRMGEPASAATHLEAALGILDGEAPDDPLRSLVLADLALTALRLGRPAEAEASAAAVLSAATSVDSGPAAVAQAYNVLGVLAAREGDLDLARERLGESLVRAETLADPSCAVAALNNLARLEAGAGDLPAALDAAHRALGMGEAYGDTHRSAALHDNLADLLHRAGREDEAREHQRQAAVLFATVDREPERRPEIWKLVEW